MSVTSVERLGSQFLEQQAAEQTVVGIGVLIVLNDLAELDDAQLQVLAVRQNESKPETGKLAGSLSIVQETVKVDSLSGTPETSTDTLIGAMDEVLDAQGMREVGDHFQRVPYITRPEIPLLSLPGKAGGLEVVVYDGPPQYAFHPAEKNEVAGGPQWITVANFLSDPTARDTSLELLGFAAGKSMLRDGIRQRDANRTIPVFPADHQFDQVRQARERRPDITKIRR